MLYQESVSVIFLQLGISNMLTLVSARERGPFITSFVSAPLGISMGVAFSAVTLLALFWSEMFVKVRRDASCMS